MTTLSSPKTLYCQYVIVRREALPAGFVFFNLSFLEKCFYLECGDELAALTWLEKIPETDTFMLTDRDSLLLEICGRSGNRAKQAAVAWRIFRRSRNAAALSRLLDVIGQDKRDSILASFEVLSDRTRSPRPANNS